MISLPTSRKVPTGQVLTFLSRLTRPGHTRSRHVATAIDPGRYRPPMQDLSVVVVVLCGVAFASGVAIVARGVNRWRAAAPPPVPRWPIGRVPEHATCRVI